MRTRDIVSLGLIVVAAAIAIAWGANRDRFRDTDRIVTIALGDACIQAPARYVAHHWVSWILSPGRGEFDWEQHLWIPMTELAAAIDNYFVPSDQLEDGYFGVLAVNKREWAAYRKAAWVDYVWSFSPKARQCEPVYDEKAGLWRLYRQTSCELVWKFFRERPDPHAKLPGPWQEPLVASCARFDKTDRFPARCTGSYAEDNVTVAYEFRLPNIVHVDDIEAFLKSQIKTTCETAGSGE